jgi:hypothetical protein
MDVDWMNCAEPPNPYFESSASMARNRSSNASMNSRHMTLMTTTFWPRAVWNRLAPQPGVPGGKLMGRNRRLSCAM